MRTALLGSMSPKYVCAVLKSYFARDEGPFSKCHDTKRAMICSPRIRM
jgi:hypothetical protein